MHYSLFADVQMVSRYCPVTQEIPCAPAVTFHVRLKCSRSCRSGSFILITSSPACIAGYLDLLVHSPHQMVCRNIPKRLIVHQANENFFIAVHPLNKQVFKLFVLNTGAKFSMLLAITASTAKGFAGSDPFFVFRCAREVRMAR